MNFECLSLDHRRFLEIGAAAMVDAERACRPIMHVHPPGNDTDLLEIGCFVLSFSTSTHGRNS